MATVAKKAAPRIKIPKLPAQVADLLYSTRQQRLDLQKQVEALVAQETALREHLINTLPKGEASGTRGKLALAWIEPKEIATIQNWDKFYSYVKKTDSFHMLPRQCNQKAVLEVLNNKKKIPGAEKGYVPVVHLNKV